MFRELWSLSPADIAKRKQEIQTQLKLLQVLLIRNIRNEEFVKFVDIEYTIVKERPLKTKTEVQLILLELITQFQNDCLQNVAREAEDKSRATKTSRIRTAASSQEVLTR